MACVVAAVLMLVAGVAAQQRTYVDPNVNMVKGITLPTGDPWLQRQNEPSIAISTRNPCHLLAGTNDYRSVSMALDDTVPPGAETNVTMAGDAWLGVFKSFDCGAKWQSTLLPGYDLDESGKAPMLKGYDAGADPTVRAGTNGLFYYSGMVFDRGTQGDSKIFVARFIDNNNKERGDPIEFIDVATIDTGTKGQFLDKPWLAVDVPRASYGPGSTLTASAATCNVGGQQIPAGNVYMAWARFTGAEHDHSKLMFAKSSDCGKTWKSHPISNNQHISQGANLAIAPHDGTIYLTWREFSVAGSPVNIWVTVSSDGGETFSNPKKVAPNVQPWDQPKTSTTFRSNSLPAITADHQNRAYIAWSSRGYGWTTDANGNKINNARIVMIVSSDRGKTWSQPFAIDPSSKPGHQMMPSLAFAAGKVQAIWYDAREDQSGVFKDYIDEKQVTNIRHTIDVRGAQATPANAPKFVAGNGGESLDLSHYRLSLVDKLGPNGKPEIGPDGKPVKTSVEVGANPPNIQMYAQATLPFIGDYIDVSGLSSFPIQTAGGQVWQPNIGSIDLMAGAAANTSTSGFPTLPIFHATWTDNRDVRATMCVADPTASAGQRNANIYTTRLSPGLYVGSPGNTKPLGKRLDPKTGLPPIDPKTGKPIDELIQRGFVVFAQNTTDVRKFYRFKVWEQPAGGRASFKQFQKPNEDPLGWVIVTIPRQSTEARTLYVTAPDVNAQILVNVEEFDVKELIGTPPADGIVTETKEPNGTIKKWLWTPVTGGLRASVLLNPDRTNPKILHPDVDSVVPEIATHEVHDPSMFDAQFFVVKARNAPVSTRFDVRNPSSNVSPNVQDPENPDPESPDPESPDPESPDPESPDPESPDPESPDPESLSVENGAIETEFNQDPAKQQQLKQVEIQDINWRVHNAGNTTSAYKFRPKLDNITPDQRFQLIVTKRSMALAMGPDCKPIYRSTNQVIVNIVNFDPKAPDPESPDPESPDPESPDPESPDPESPDPESPDPESPDPESANFFLAPDETATVTLRKFDFDETNDTPDPPEGKKRDEVAAKTAAQAANTDETTVSTAATNADLTLVDAPAVVSPALARPSHQATVTFTLSNRGTQAATTDDGSPIQIKVYLSKNNNVLDGADTPITTREQASPFPNCTGENEDLCTRQFDVNFIVPDVAGQFYVIVIADPGNTDDPDGAVFEGDEFNNDVRIPFTVENYTLTFTQQPTATTQDFTMAPVTVAVTHPDGAAVTAAEVPGGVTVSLAPASGNLSGTVARPVVPSGGVTPSLATYFDLSIAEVGTGYTLSATAPFSNAAISAAFNIETDLPPVTVNDAYTTNEETALNQAAPGVLANDSDPATKGTKPAAYVFDAVKETDPANGTVTVNTDGSFTYTPNASFSGPDSFTYRARDGRPGNSTIGTATITVTNVNDAPSFTKGANQTELEDSGAHSVPGWATALSAGPANESSQLLDFIVTNDNNLLFSVQPAVTSTGTLTYTTASNAVGSATITVRIHDNGTTANGGVDTSAPQTFTITLTPVNDPPNFTKGADQTALEESGAHTVAGWATAINAGPTDEAGQLVDFLVTNDNNALFSVQPAIASNGTLTYTSAANANGAATVTVRAHDNGGLADGGVDTGAAQTFTITITAVNDAPSFTKGANQTAGEDSGARTVNGWATAISAGPANESSQAVDFIVTNDNDLLFAVQPAVSSNGTLTFTGATNKNGVATVTVRIHDNGTTANGGVDTSGPQTFTITIDNVNDPPVAVADSYTTNEDTTVGRDAVDDPDALLDNDTDTDNDSLVAEYLTTTTNGILSPHANGSFSYVPNANFFGTDSFTYRAFDGTTTGNTVTVTFNVLSVNDAPTFTKGANVSVPMSSAAQTFAGWATAISAGPANEAAQALNFIVTNNNNGIFNVSPAIAANGTLTFTPKNNQQGTATVTVQLHDNGGVANGGVDTSAAQTFTITLTNTPQTYVVTNTNDSGAGSLRAALINANANNSPDTITFNIPGGGVRTIAPVTALPAIVFPVVINATTQPGFAGTPLIELNGAGAGAGARGFVIDTDNVTIRGFIINRFSGDGVKVNGTSNVVAGNWIGTNATGVNAQPNGGAGVAVAAASNMIGGTTAADRNVLSGNTLYGVTVQGNTSSGNVIKGNYIGTNASGTAAVGNTNHGVWIETPATVQVGGDNSGDGNVISGNTASGVQIYACAPTLTCNGHVIAGNRIGTNAAGTAAVANLINGIDVFHAPNNTIRGNLISGNGGAPFGGVVGAAIAINSELASIDPDAELHYGNQIVTGNKIGTDVTGVSALPNQMGVVLTGQTKARIGGTTTAERNIIAYQTQYGIVIGMGDSNNNTVQGNYIGVNANLQAAGNGSVGIYVINHSTNNLIGGAAPGAGNVIGGHASNNGIRLSDGQLDNNTIQGNFVGTDPTGTLSFGNIGGIHVEDANNLVKENRVANNTFGIMVSNGTGNRLEQNSVYNNSALGIDLLPGGVTANDAGDGDAGANNLQNYPVITGAFVNGGTTFVTGTLNSTPNSTYTIELFSNSAADSSGFGEGQTYQASLAVATDGAGNASFSTTLAIALASGSFVTATATDADGNTSEFSLARIVVVNTPPTATNDQVLTVGDFAMTTNPGSNDVDPDVASPQVRTTYQPVGGFGPFQAPGKVAVVTSTGRGYFTGANQSAGTTGKIGILDLATNTVVGAIPLPGNFASNFSEVDQAAEIVFFRGGINLLAVDARPASPTFNQLLLNINLGTINSWALDSPHHRLYVTTQTTGSGLIANGRLTVFDTDRGSPTFLQVIAEASVPSPNGTATAIGVNTVTNKIYVAVTGTQPGVYVVPDPTTLAMIQVFNNNPNGNVTSIAINDVDNLIYAAGQSVLHAVDGTNDTKIGQVVLVGNASTGATDSRVVIHRGTGRVYVRSGGFPNPSNLVVVDGKRGSPTINTIVTTINLGRENGTAFMAVDEGIDRLIATSTADLRSHIIDTTSNAIVGTIMATQSLGRVSLDPAAHRAYLTGGLGYIKVVDVAAAAVVTDVHVATEIFGMAIDPLTHTAYVSETGLTTAVKRLSETGISGSIPLPHGDGREVYAFRNSATNKIYVLNGSATAAGGSEALPGFVHVIDGNSNTVTASVPVGPVPFGLAVDEANNKIFAGNGNIGSAFFGGISIIDGVTNAVTQADVSAIPSVNNPPNISVGRDMVVTTSGRLYFRVIGGASTQMLGMLNGTVATPVAIGNVNVNIIQYNPVLNRLYVGTTPVTPGPNQVLVIDPATNQIVATLTAGSATTFRASQSYIAVNRTTGRVFISDFDENQLVVVDGNTNAIMATLPMPFGPSTVAVDEVRNRVYVGNAIARNLTIVDGASLRVARTLALPIAPILLAVDASLSPARIYVHATANEGAISVVDDPGTAAPQIISVTQGAHGTVVLNADGSVTYTPNAGYTGTDSYTYTASDGQGGTTTSTANVTVYAEMSIQPATLPNGLVGQNYSQTLTKTGGSGSPVVWTVSGFLPGGVHLSSSGVLSGVLQQSGNFTFTVNARDTGQALLSETRTYTVNVGPPIVGPVTLPNPTINVPYSQQLFAAGATGAVTWSLNTNGHPALNWLSLSSAGVLSGTPTAYGSLPSFTVTATDSAPVPQTASRTYSNSVGGPLTMADLREGIVLETEPSVSFLGGNGTKGLTITGGALPPGIVLGTGGVFTGTPTRHGTYNFTLELRDCLNNSCNPNTAQQVVNKNIDWRVSAKDQQGSSNTGGPSLALGGSPNRKLAQVFTVGAQGTLTAIGLSNLTCSSTQSTVTVEVQRLNDQGEPDGVTIADGETQSNFNAIAITPAIPVAIGERLAFVATVWGTLSCTFPNSTTYDSYNAGDAYYSTDGAWSKLALADVDNNGTVDGVYDIPSFRTLIMPAMDVTYLTSSFGGATTTLLNDGKVLIAGGSSTKTALLYDPVTQSTTVAGQMNMLRQNATATLLGDGTVLIVGGREPNGNKNAQAEIYDPVAGTFTPTNNNLANSRDNHRAVRYVHAGAEKVLITGGVNPSGSNLAAVEIYDPVTKTFSMSNNNSNGRQSHAAVLLNNGKILIAGGYTNGGVSAETFDPATNLWTPTGAMVVANRGQATGTLLDDGRVLIAGGQATDVRSEAEIYDPSIGFNGQFAATGSMATPRYNHTATLLADGTVLVAGGSSEQNLSSFTLPQATLERFDPATGTFSGAGSMETRRGSHGAVRLGNGKVFLVGGFSQSWMTGNTGELYDQAASPALSPTTLAAGSPGAAYADVVFSGNGGSGGPYTITHAGGTLPTGMTYTSATKTLGGTPSETGLYHFALQVTDSANHSMVQSYSLLIGSINTITSPYRLPDAQQNNPYSYQLTATGPNNTWSVLPSTSATSITNPPPPGIALSSSGLLSGTPTAQNYYNFGVRAIDANGVEAVKVVAISVQPPFTINTTTLTNPELFSPLSCISTSNGNGTKTFSIVSGALPVGVTFNGTTGSSCVSFTGVPKQTGEFTFRVRITDASANPQTAERDYTIKVYAADQQSINGGGNGFNFGAGTGTKLAERVITAITGTLRGVRMHGLSCPAAGTNVSVEIQGLDPAGKPNGQVLATGNGVSPLGTIYLSTDVFFNADEPFAIVFDAGATCNLRPSTFDAYPGDGFISNGGGAWQRVNDFDNTRHDVPFTTIVQPIPGLTALNFWRSRGTQTLLDDGRVLIAGGDCCQSPSVAEVYDPATNTTTATGPMIGTRQQHAAALLPNSGGKVLIAGGNSHAGTRLSTAELYDPATNSFTATGSLNAARSNFAATVLQDGKVLITGGNNSANQIMNSAEIYDPAAGTFSNVPNTMLHSRRDHTATLMADGRVLIAGGYGSGGGTGEIYTPGSQTFAAPSSSMTNGRAQHTATLVGTKVLLIGGNGSMGEAVATTELFDPAAGANGTFTLSYSMSIGRIDHTAVKLGDGSVLVAGGYTDNTCCYPHPPTALMERYVPGTGIVNAGSAIVSRYLHGATLMGNGKVLIAGTSNSFSSAAGRTAELFDADAMPPYLMVTETTGASGSPLNFTLQPAGGAGGPYTMSLLSGTLPTGAQLNLGSGLLDGTPTQSGTFRLTIEIEDGAGRSSRQLFTLRIDAITITTTSLPTAYLGVNYGGALSATGLPNITWSMVGNNQLPPGLTLNQNTGAITGAPTVNCCFYSFTVKATDGIGQSTQKTLSITVQNPLSVNTTTLGDGTAGSVYFGGLSAGGSFTNPLTWSISGQPLGLQINPSTGSFVNLSPGNVLREGGQFTINAQVTDGSNPQQLASQNIPLNVFTYDQQIFGGGGANVTLPSTRRIAQVFRASTTQPLQGVRAGAFTCTAGVVVTASVFPVTLASVPDDSGAPLATATRTADVNGNFSNFMFSSPVSLAQREKFAVVYEANGSCTQASWGSNDFYPYGDGFVSDNHGAWTSAFADMGRYDLPHETLIYPPSSMRFLAGYRQNHATAVLNDGRLLLVGGASNEQHVEIYHPATSTFTFVTQNMTHSRLDPTATTLPNGKVLIAGGSYYNGSQWVASNDVQLFDPATNTFSSGQNMSRRRVKARATLLNNGKVLITGGQEDGVGGVFTSVDSADLYDSAGNLIAVLTMEVARAAHTATLLADGKVLIVGGWTPCCSNHVAELYDPSDDTFTGIQGGGINWPTQHTANLITAGSRAGQVLIFGGHPGGNYYFDPSTNNFSSAPTPPGQRIDHASVTLPNGRILLLGGTSDITYQFDSSSVEMWDPTTEDLAVLGDLVTDRQYLQADLVMTANGLRVAVSGGSGSSQWTAPRSIEFFDPTVVMGSFAAATSMTQARRSHVAVQLDNGTVLLAGSDNNNATAEIYNPSTNTTSAINNMIAARCYGCAYVKLQSGKVLIAGGWTTSGPVLNTAEVYNPATGQFTATAGNMTANRLGANAVLLNNGKVLILGGHNGFSGYSSAELFDPATETFSATGSLSTVRLGAATIKLQDGKVLVAGGVNGNIYLNTAEIYDPATGQFTTTTGNMVTGRQAEQPILLNDGRVLIAGGYSSGFILNSPEVYNPVSGTFSAVGAMSTARSGHFAVKLPNGAVVVGAGLDGSSVSLNTAEMFNPYTNTFTRIADLPSARVDARAILLGDGRIMITGGASSGNNRVATVEYYTP